MILLLTTDSRHQKRLAARAPPNRAWGCSQVRCPHSPATDTGWFRRIEAGRLHHHLRGRRHDAVESRAGSRGSAAFEHFPHLDYVVSSTLTMRVRMALRVKRGFSRSHAYCSAAPCAVGVAAWFDPASSDLTKQAVGHLVLSQLSNTGWAVLSGVPAVSDPLNALLKRRSLEYGQQMLDLEDKVLGAPPGC